MHLWTDLYSLKKEEFFEFLFLNKNFGAIIRIGREILSLPYSEFFDYVKCQRASKSHYWLKVRANLLNRLILKGLRLQLGEWHLLSQPLPPHLLDLTIFNRLGEARANLQTPL